MKISAKTVYSVDKLLGFNYHFARTKLWFYILLAVSTVLVTGAFTMSLALDFCDLRMILCFAAVLLIDAVTVYTHFIHPRFAVKKAPALDATVCFEFTDVNFTISAKNDRFDETSTSSYSNLVKVSETDAFIYLYISKVQAFIVDKSGFTEGTPEALLDLLASKGVKRKRR